LVFWFVVSMLQTMFAKHQTVSKSDSNAKLRQYYKEFCEEKRNSKEKSGLFDNLIREEIINVVESA